MRIPDQKLPTFDKTHWQKASFATRGASWQWILETQSLFRDIKPNLESRMDGDSPITSIFILTETAKSRMYRLISQTWQMIFEKFDNFATKEVP